MSKGTVVLGFGPQSVDWLTKATKVCGPTAVMCPNVARMAGANLAAGDPEALAELRKRLEAGALQPSEPLAEIYLGDGPAWNEAFEAWWEAHGQYCRAGGGDYEKTFAFRAWETAVKTTPPTAQPAAPAQAVAWACWENDMDPSKDEPLLRLSEPFRYTNRRPLIYGNTTQTARPVATDRSGCSAGTDEECTNKACARACPSLAAAAQPAAQWVGLTGEDDVIDMARDAFATRFCRLPVHESRIRAFANAIDAKLREKNGFAELAQPAQEGGGT